MESTDEFPAASDLQVPLPEVETLDDLHSTANQEESIDENITSPQFQDNIPMSTIDNVVAEPSSMEATALEGGAETELSASASDEAPETLEVAEVEQKQDDAQVQEPEAATEAPAEPVETNPEPPKVPEASDKPQAAAAIEPSALEGGVDVTSKTGEEQGEVVSVAQRPSPATSETAVEEDDDPTPSALRGGQSKDGKKGSSGPSKEAIAVSKTAQPSEVEASSSSSAAVATPSGVQDTFSFADYDIVGMDLDCTLTKFNTEALMKNVYLGLMRYLVNVKEYDRILLTEKEYTWEEGKAFLQRGLVLDAQKGNVVKLDSDGGIMKAAHGKTFLTPEEMRRAYGDERNTAIFKDYAKTFREVAGTIYCVQDIFILPALLANANLVQLQDRAKASTSKDGKAPTGNYKTWADVFAGLLELYRRERFADKTGEFFSAILVDTKSYVKPTGEKFKAFMKTLRKDKKLLFLLTGSNFDYTNFLCEFCLGKDWKEYFDVVICHAGKPGFFTGIRPFYVSGRNTEITDPLNHLNRGEVYMMGNWRDLYAWFTKQLDKKEAKAVYVGDNMVLDIISAAKFTNCKAIAVMEELEPGFGAGAAAKWGSIFAERTLWATMLRRYTLMAIPSVDTLAENPVDHKYKIFTGKQEGFHPPIASFIPVPK